MPEDSSCETGWLQFRQDKCYRFVHIRLAFDDAELLCNNLYGGHLPSIHSQEEQFMISQFLASVNVKNGSEIWLGGRQMDFHNFNWGDGSLFNYSYWEHGEPNFPAEKCIEMSWRNGRWNDINCRLKRAVLCERQVGSRHLIKPILYQPTTCLESNCTTNNNNHLSISGQSTIDSIQQSEHEQISSTIQSSSVPTIYNNNNNITGSVDGSSMINTTQSIATSNRTNNHEDSASLLVDDKPIKVISSIMHREQSQYQQNMEPSLISGSNISTLTADISSNSTSSGGTFILYNLPPPSRLNEDYSNSNAKQSTTNYQAANISLSSTTQSDQQNPDVVPNSFLSNSSGSSLSKNSSSLSTTNTHSNEISNTTSQNYVVSTNN